MVWPLANGLLLDERGPNTLKEQDIDDYFSLRSLSMTDGGEHYFREQPSLLSWRVSLLAGRSRSGTALKARSPRSKLDEERASKVKEHARPLHT